MDKSSKTILIVIGAVLLLFIVLSWLAPKPPDWTPTYNTKDKIPMGMYVLDKEIDSLFGGAYVERSKESPDTYFYEGIFDDSVLIDVQLLYINQNLNWTDSEVSKACRFVRDGNTAFISAIEWPKSLLDSVKAQVVSFAFYPQMQLFSDTVTVSMADSCLNVPPVRSNTGISGSYFSVYDTTVTSVLGYNTRKQDKQVNFIVLPYGRGQFFIHLEPAVFTNYFLLRGQDHRIAESTLSYLSDGQDVIWSLYNQTSKVISDSPFRFILSQPALRWAWYLVLAGILMFVLFNIRRNQRAIRTIPHPLNSSVEFARTIGNLYFQEGNINTIIHRKIIYLLERIRSDYHLSTDTLDEKFMDMLHHRTGKDRKVIEKMIFLVNKHKEYDYTCTTDDLSRLNAAIENFYKPQ